MSWLNNLIVKIKGDKTQLDSTLKSSESSIGGWGKRVAGIFAAAFGVSAIISFGKEVIGLANKAEGVKTAFQTLNAPGLLQGLRLATRGTVTDFQLMQKAIQARNFQIPLSQLATYFEFATKRAIQTGESVDYLVDSIITGIGRKSVLVMDNLGISAASLQKEIQKTGDFGIAAGNIIRGELTSMGEVADTTAIKIASISTAWQNIKGGIGAQITQSPIFQSITNWVANVGKFAQAPGMSLAQAIYGATFKADEFNKILDDSNKAISENSSAILKQAEAKKKASQWAIEGASAGYGKVPGQVSTSGIKPTIKLAEKSFDQQVREVLGIQEGLASGPSIPEGINLMRDETVVALENFNYQLSDLFKEGVMIVTDSIEDMFAAMTSGDWSSFGNKLLIGFANFLSMFGKLLIAYAVSLEAFQSTMGNIFTWPVALAAGVGAIAIAGLIKGAASKAGSTVNSGGASGGGGYGSAQMNNMQVKVIVEGKTSGKDIYWSNKRYESELNQNT
jgi:hypothetical protein